MISIIKDKKILQKTAAVLLVIAIWQAAAMAVGQQILLASPFAVLKRLCTVWQEPNFLSIIWFTFSKIVSGFFLALFLGLSLAVLAGRFSLVEILLWPFMIMIKSVPVASFIIISLIWLTTKELSVFIAFLMVLPIVYTNVLQGIKSTDAKLLQMAEIFRLPFRKRFFYIWIPQMKPYLISACSVSLGLSWKAGIAAEIIGIPDGSIGEMFYNAKVYLNTVDLFAWTIIVVVISVVFEKIFMFLLRKGFGRLTGV